MIHKVKVQQVLLMDTVFPLDTRQVTLVNNRMQLRLEQKLETLISTLKQSYSMQQEALSILEAFDDFMQALYVASIVWLVLINSITT